jgi:outer membrane protein
MRGRVPAAVIVAVLATVATAAAQMVERRLSLEEAVAIALEQSPVIAASEAGRDAGQAKAGEAAASRLPSIKMEAGYRRLSEVPEFGVRLPGSNASVVIVPNIPDTYTLRVGVQQPLFTGFRLASNARAAELLAGAAEADYLNTRGTVTLAVTTAYWTLYQAGQTRRFTGENLDRIERYVTDTRNLVDAGLATRNDLLRVEVQRSNARLARIDADNDVKTAAMQLCAVLGLDPETPLTPASEPPEPATGEERADSGALRVRHDLRAMEYRVDAAKEFVTAARAGWWPQVAFSANLYDSRPNSRYMPATDVFKSSWDVGVGLQWDLWNWLTPAYQSDQALAQLRQSESLLRQARDRSTLEIARARLGIGHAAEKIAVAREAVEQATENVRSLTDKYRTGLATSTELLDAEVSLLQANTGLSGAKVEYAVARARLEQALGMPEERAVGE